jgi:LysM repeat protein
VVQKGDNLSTIARKFRILPQQLMAINHLRSTVVRPGQKLKLSTGPVSVGPSPTGRRVAAPATGKVMIYTVRRKDTLTSIARKFQKKPQDLMKANNLKTAIIRPYQRLKIPL